MSRFHRLLIALATGLIAVSSGAQTYELSGKWNTAEWTAGTWNGQHSLPGVYCLTFPAPTTAIKMGYGFFNQNGIFLTQVIYPDRSAVSIVTSTIPAGRSASEEIARLLTYERQAEAAYGVSYNIVEGNTDFGPTLSLRIKNVAPRGRNGPFPLVRPIIRPAKEPIETMSVHRLFVRGPDRFEVAAMQLAPEAAGETTEAEMTKRLSTLADQVVNALQTCTEAIPIRAPK